MTLMESSPSTSQWLAGRIKFYSLEKGYGFIFRQGMRDIYFHNEMLRNVCYLGKLNLDTPVEFKFKFAAKGPAATTMRELPRE